MKKLQKLMSIGIAMTLLLLTITGCSNSNDEQVSTLPTTDVEQNQEESQEEVTDEDESEEEVTDEEESQEEVTDDEESQEEVTDDEESQEEVTDEEESQEEVTDDEESQEEVTDEEESQEDVTDEEESEDEVQTTEFQQLAPPQAGDTVATIKVTGFGDIKIKFFEDKAPLAVENFVTHAKAGYFDGIIFHRVINDFMIQGGDPTGTGRGGQSIWGTPFVNEDDSDLYHFNGAVSMANAGKDTNGSQFFIVNSSPDYPRSSSREYSDYAKEIYSSVGGVSQLDGGYTVFGQVYEGLEIVQSIMQVQKTGSEGSTPVENVVIESVTITEYK